MRPSEHSRHEVPADALAVRLILDVRAQHPLFHQRAQRPARRRRSTMTMTFHSVGCATRNADVRDQVAGVDRMPDEACTARRRRRRGWPGTMPKLRPSVDLADDRRCTQADGRQQRRHGVGRRAPASRRRAAAAARPPTTSSPGAAVDRSIDEPRAAAEHRQHDDQRLAGQQQQAGQVAGAHEVAEQVDRQQREQHADDRRATQIGASPRRSRRRPSVDLQPSAARLCGAAARPPALAASCRRSTSAHAASSSSRVIDRLDARDSGTARSPGRAGRAAGTTRSGRPYGA